MNRIAVAIALAVATLTSVISVHPKPALAWTRSCADAIGSATYECANRGNNYQYNKSTMAGFWGWKLYGNGGTLYTGKNPHNCTLFAAFMLWRNGYTNPAGGSFGDASKWGQNVPQGSVSGIPAKGAIAWFRAGHVAYVESFTGTSPDSRVDVISDNYGRTQDKKDYDPERGYTSLETYTVKEIANAGGFIHLADVPVAPAKPGAPPSGSPLAGTAVTNPSSGLCLDVPRGLAWGEGFNESPPAVQLYQCNITAAQLWAYDPVTQSLQVYASPNTRCLDIAGGNQSNGVKVQVWQCNNSAAQKWTFRRDGTVRSTQGFCLDAKDRGKTSGTRLQIWQCLGSPGDNQRWGGLAATLSTPTFAGVIAAGGANVRAAATTSAAKVRSAAAGSTVSIACQVLGQAVATGKTTYAIWDRLVDGNFVWDGALSNTAVMTWDSRIRRC
jgi:hypothetical protein